LDPRPPVSAFFKRVPLSAASRQMMLKQKYAERPFTFSFECPLSSLCADVILDMLSRTCPLEGSTVSRIKSARGLRVRQLMHNRQICIICRLGLSPALAPDKFEPAN